MRTLSRLFLTLTVFLPPALWGQSALATEWFGAGGDQGVHYLGNSKTTGGSTPSIGTQTDNGTPQGLVQSRARRHVALPDARAARSGAPHRPAK